MKPIDPKTEIIINLAMKKILQRFPLSFCMMISMAILTYVFIFYDILTTSSAMIIISLTFFIALTTSFALEYDTRDEIMALVNVGVSPSDIFKLSIFRVWLLSFIGYLVGVTFATIFPLHIIRNAMVLYTFLLSSGLGFFTSLYSALKAMHMSLLGRLSFRPIFEREIPVLLSINELPLLKEYVEARLKERNDIIILNISEDGGKMEISCRYLGDFGRETFGLLASLGISPDKSLKDDNTLPIITARINVKEGKRPTIECWEGKNKKSQISYSFQALIQQLIIEYKVYSGKIRGMELRS